MVTASGVTICETCGKELHLSEHPFCPHGFKTVTEYRPFRPYFDFALGAQITSLAQWNRTMREKHADLTDSMSPGRISARKDKCMAIRKAQGRKT
jgi:hypothetical protein